MRLCITPIRALFDQKIKIKVCELPPRGKVTLKATMSYPWAKSLVFESTAVFTADEKGVVDLEKQAPDSGDYNGVDSMGLITSMRHCAGNLNDANQGISVDNNLLIDITGQWENDIESIQLERLFKSPEIKRQKIDSPFVGEFFCADNVDRKTIIVLGGSNGDLGQNLPIASLLASYGFNVLTVAYFKEKGLPKDLAEIPLEYFDKVFDWLDKNPVTTGKDLYLYCISKGAELGLLLASLNSNIKKIVAFAPHAYCFQALNFKNVSSWTYEGKALPYIRLKNSTVIGNMLGNFIKNKPFGYTHTYKKSILDSKNTDAARIKIENAKADILMFAGREDNIWNTFDGCTEIMETLKKAKYSNEYKLITYEGVGHPFYAPYFLPTYASTEVKIGPRMRFSNGGTPQKNTDAVVDSWEKMLSFLMTT